MCESKKEGQVIYRFVVESTLSNSMKIGGRLRSDVWDHFTPFQDVDGSRKGKCNYCAKNFFADSKKNGTSSLRAHIKTCKRLPSTSQSSSQPIRNDEEDEDEDEYERFLFRNIKKKQVRIDSYFKKLSEPS